MTITAKVIAHSVAENCPPIISVQARYPRFIHAELMTHRVFSRNASSSRAIPVERLIQDIIDDTAMPMHWGKNQAGMQAREEHNAPVAICGNRHPKQTHASREEAWTIARDKAINMARAFSDAGYHKQVVNRLLEPFAHINVLITSTQWSNFFALRDHPDAQPEIRVLAQAIKAAIDASTPQKLSPGEWHLPYVDAADRHDLVYGDGVTVGELERKHGATKPFDLAIRVSVARCARVSYLTQEGKRPTIEADLALYDRLLASVPLHASPAEHQATPDTGGVFVDASGGPDARKPYFRWDNFEKHGNLRGWIQYRKTLPGECQ